MVKSGVFLVFLAFTRECCAERALRIHITANRTEYCRTAGATVARLTLNVHLENTGQVPVVVSKLIDITRFDLSPTADDLARGKYAQSRRMEPVPMVGSSLWSRKEPTPEFFYRIPGRTQIIAGKRQLLLLLTERESRGRQTLLSNGPYYLRVQMDPWRESSGLGRRLQSAWENLGKLQLERIVSQSLAIELFASQDLPECKGPPLILRE